MRIAIIGAGGVGGYFGGMLAKHGEHDIWFVARGRHLETIQQEGLTIDGVDERFTIPVQATNNPVEIGEVDVVFYCVKTYSDAQTKDLLQPLLGESTVVISLQNGVEKEATLARWVGRERVIGGLCYIESSIKEPGVIEQKSARKEIILGELDGTITDRMEAIKTALADAGIKVTVTTNIYGEIWKKFIFISSFSAITTITKSPIGPIREYPVTYDLLVQLIREGYAVSQTYGANLPDDIVDSILTIANSFEPGTKSSMQKDYEKGNAIEVEDLSGSVYRLGKEKGVPTPVHQTIYGVLSL